MNQESDSNMCKFNAFKTENTTVLSRCEYNHGSEAVWLGWISRKMVWSSSENVNYYDS